MKNLVTTGEKASEIFLLVPEKSSSGKILFPVDLAIFFPFNVSIFVCIQVFTGGTLFSAVP